MKRSMNLWVVAVLLIVVFALCVPAWARNVTGPQTFTDKVDLSGGVAIEGTTVSATAAEINQLAAGTAAIVMGEATIDGKYGVVGPNATTGLMLAKGVATNGQAKVAFGVTFGAVPTVICQFTNATFTAGSAMSNFVTAITVTTSNFVPVSSAPVLTLKRFNWIAVGSRP